MPTNGDGPNRNELIARKAFAEFYKGQDPGPHALVHWQRLVEIVGRLVAGEWDRTLGAGGVVHAYRWVAHHTANITCMPEHETRPDPRTPGMGPRSVNQPHR